MFDRSKLSMPALAVSAALAFCAPLGGMQDADVADGQALFVANCAQCHGAGVPGAISRAQLSRLDADRVRSALTTGAMAAAGSRLGDGGRERVIAYLASGTASTPAPPTGTCAGSVRAFDPSVGSSWSGWGAGPDQRRFQPAERAGLSAADVPRLRLKWAFAFPDAAQAYGQPAVKGGWAFVGSVNGNVYALDASTGCEAWSFAAASPVRTAPTIGERAGRWLVYFGDQGGEAYALDAETGALVWRTEVDAHLSAAVTGAPVLVGDRLLVPMSSVESGLAGEPRYPCCTFRGSVSALDADSGELLWTSRTIAEEPRPARTSRTGVQNFGPSGAAVWSAPVVDTLLGRVYVVTGNGYSDPVAETSDSFLAFDLATGELLWTRQVTADDGFTVDCDFGPFRSNCPDAAGPDFDLISPLLVDLPGSGRALIAGQKAGLVHALDPDRDGAPLWVRRVGEGSRIGGVHWGIASDGRHVYVANSDATMMNVPPGTPGSETSPLLGGLAFMPGPDAGGGLFALDVATGEVAWRTPNPGCEGALPGCSPGQSAAVTVAGDVVYSGDLGGRIRAYAAEDGRVLWEFDTRRPYDAVNGVAAVGGAIDGPGPVVVDGVLYVSSGYAFTGTAPGNVLLAFSVDGR